MVGVTGFGPATPASRRNAVWLARASEPSGRNFHKPLNPNGSRRMARLRFTLASPHPRLIYVCYRRCALGRIAWQLKNSSTKAEAAQRMHARLTHAGAPESERGSRDDHIADTLITAFRLGICCSGRKAWTCRYGTPESRPRRHAAAGRHPGLCAACARRLAPTVTSALANRIDVPGCRRAAAARACRGGRLRLSAYGQRTHAEHNSELTESRSTVRQALVRYREEPDPVLRHARAEHLGMRL